jgi:uncharacterized membrane protein YuzA (DUF378 family)
MRSINLITLALLIVGGLNWGLVGLFNFDLVAALFGEMSLLSRVVYTLVGLSALWQIVPLVRGTGAEQGRPERPDYRPHTRRMKLNREKDVDSSDMDPKAPDGPKPAVSEEAQKEAAEERESDGGYQ